MGSGRFDSGSWENYASSRSYATASTDQIYTSRQLAQELNPRGITFRESRDSADNPQSTPVIVGLDVTGSMSMVLDAMARQGLNRLMTEVYDREPISDPHLLVMGIGDAEAGDRAPLQVTQFEADLRIAQQLERIWLERGGGGNRYESYALAWYFAAYHTATDSMAKRGKRGYLFTVGDEEPTPGLRKRDVQRVLGYEPVAERDLSAAGILAAARAGWDVFHVIVAEGSHARSCEAEVRARWADVLGQRAIWLADHTKLAEVVVSTMQVNEGADADTVAATWDAATAAVVSHAVRGISLGGVPA